jgi:cell division protein FtsA
LASADAVLSEDEKQLGAAILDIGGGTADFAIYQQGTIRHTKVFPIAGNHVTNDIALCLRTTIKDAERVKREYGQAILTDMLSEDECKVEMVHGVDLKKIKVSSLIGIIEPRITELFLMIKEEISKQHLECMMPAGLVLTGGGALLKNIEIAAREILDIPARIGNPFVSGLFKQTLESPIYATGYGLLLHVLKKNEKNLHNQLTGPLMTRILWRMKSWIADFF